VGPWAEEVGVGADPLEYLCGGHPSHKPPEKQSFSLIVEEFNTSTPSIVVF